MKVIGRGSAVRMEDKPRGKCRRWRLTVQTDKGPKRRRFEGTYTEAQQALARFVGELSVPVSGLTFGEWVAMWFDLRRRNPDIAASTVRKNETHANVLNRVFKDVLLSDITPSSAEGGLLDIRSEGNLSGTYMNQCHTLMKQVMEAALDEGMIPSNPLRKVKAPKKDTEGRRSLSRGEMQRFVRMLDALPLDAHTVATRLAVLSGLRRGEICALQWGDVSEGVIRVRRSVQEHGMEVKAPKTAAGVRDVPMVSQLEEALAVWKALQGTQMEVLGLPQADSTFVCASVVGTMMHPGNLDRWWRRKREMFGLDGVTLHELRHTYLTMVASSGAPASVLKSLAGWSDISMANIYIHEDADANRAAADALEAMLGGTTDGTAGGTTQSCGRIA